jgi:hypothetical protein
LLNKGESHLKCDFCHSRARPRLRRESLLFNDFPHDRTYPGPLLISGGSCLKHDFRLRRDSRLKREFLTGKPEIHTTRQCDIHTADQCDGRASTESELRFHTAPVCDLSQQVRLCRFCRGAKFPAEQGISKQNNPTGKQNHAVVSSPQNRLAEVTIASECGETRWPNGTMIHGGLGGLAPRHRGGGLARLAYQRRLKPSVKASSRAENRSSAGCVEALKRNQFFQFISIEEVAS